MATEEHDHEVKIKGGSFDLSGSADKTDLTLVFGHTDEDFVTFDHTYLGATTRAYGSYSAARGDASIDGEDRFLVDHLQTMAVKLSTRAQVAPWSVLLHRPFVPRVPR